MIHPHHLSSAGDLVTSYEETRAGFLAIALEKGRRAAPYVEEARALAAHIAAVSKAEDIAGRQELRAALVAAAGLSDKAAGHLGEEGCAIAIREFTEKFLIPAGAKFREELVYRFLLTRGGNKVCLGLPRSLADTGFQQRGYLPLRPAAAKVSPDSAYNYGLGFIRLSIPVCPHEVEGRGLRLIKKLNFLVSRYDNSSKPANQKVWNRPFLEQPSSGAREGNG